MPSDYELYLERLFAPPSVERPSQVLPPVWELGGAVSVDTETSGLYPDDGDRPCAVSVAYRTPTGELVRHAFPFDQGRPEQKGFEVQRLKSGALRGGTPEAELEPWLADLNLPEEEWHYLIDWLVASGQAVGHVYQNAGFDLLMVDAGTRTGWPGAWLEPYVVWDTMLVSRNLWPTSPTGLKPTAARLWGGDTGEDAGAVRYALTAGKKIFGLRAEHGPRYDLIPWAVNGPYAAQDAELTLRLFERQVADLEDGLGTGWREVTRSRDLMRVLARMSRRGFGPYAAEPSHAWANLLADRMEALVGELPFAPATPVRASEYYFDELGARPWKPGEQPRGFDVGTGGAKRFVPGKKADKADVARRFPGEAITFRQGELSADIAERIDAPGARAWAEYQRLRIANQMFYRMYAELAGPDGKLRTTFRQAHVKSGRISVERFQAHALPKGLHLRVAGHPVPEPRAFFGVPEGRTRWNLDLSQAELRIAGNLAECTGLMQELNVDGGDVHGRTCERTFRITPEHPEWKAKRDVAKRLNFGGIFMIGPKTFRENLWTQGGVEWSLAQCRDAVYAFRDAYPEIERSYEYWMAYGLKHGCVRLWNGERSWMTSYDYPRTAWNRVVQGGLAVWVAEWLTLVEQLTEKHDALVLSVHDSAILDLPEDVAEDVVKRVVSLSEELWVDRFGFPGRVDADVWRYHEGVELQPSPEVLAAVRGAGC